MKNNLSTNVSSFFKYLQSLKLFFGSKVLTTTAFITLYLNYDTSNNVMREVLKEMLKERSKKELIEINNRVIDFISSHPEEASKKAYEPLGKDIVLSKELYEKLDGIEAKELNKFMYECFKESYPTLLYKNEMCNERYFINFCFNVCYTDLLKKVNEKLNCMPVVLESDLKINNKFSSIISVIDGKRENYKLSTRNDIKDLYWMTLSKRRRTNVVLIGDDSTGKTDIIQNLAYQIDHRECDEKFWDVKVLRVDIMEIISKARSVESIQPKLVELVTTIISLQRKTNNKMIVFLDRAHLAFAANTMYRLFYLLIPLFESNDISVIMSLDQNNSKQFINETSIYKSTFFIYADVLKPEEILPCIEPTIYSLEIYHGVSISQKLVQTALLYSKAFKYGESTIVETLDLIDVAMGVAKSNNRNRLLLEDISSYFKMEFSGYEEQSDEIKRLTAYHEAGHFVVNRFCKNIKFMSTNFITIIPSGDAGGFNLYEIDVTKITDTGYATFIEQIAFSLGGRVSEELFLKSITAGAQADLEEATKIATEMVTKLGLDKVKNSNSIIERLLGRRNDGTFVIKGNENMMSQKAIDSVSVKTDKIMNEAYQIAKRILKKHEQYVESLAQLLLKEKIVPREEILKLEYKVGNTICLKEK